jgi:phosphoribosylformylglycinamidine synthase PurS subunit
MRVKERSRDAAAERVRAMCERLLANKVIEDYRVEVDEETR